MSISNPNSNYLPVLLVSVSTIAAPDDNFVAPRPRGQVDYLSHEWQEEDVWRSWRNMTRQKKEIANGARLENASWRTWWKQRNKLKTVSPETLNWLKDSDVTWLYGPLHTASDDQPLKLSGNSPCTPSTTEAPPRITKPILKYRSISELLTSDLPTSPIFSPPDSEDEVSRPPPPPAAQPGTSAPSPGAVFKRPKLLHTKSDTHITRWGPNRAYRKDSPPRIEPPGHIEEEDDYFPKVSAGGAVRSSLSQDSNSSTGNSTERTGKKKHISFNTFVEQVIAIDKPKRSASFYGAGEKWDPSRIVYDDDDGYEEDQEDSADEEASLESTWPRQHIPSGVHGYPYHDDIEEEGEDGIIEMRSSFRHITPKKTPRSQSKASNTSSSSSVSTASSTTTSSTANSSSSPTRNSGTLSSISTAKRNSLSRRTSASTYRPARGGPPDHVHVTIAPIAPTVLKTELWEEGFGDDGGCSDDGFGWRERLWNHGSDGKGKGTVTRGRGRADDEGSDASGTPVELVYVPPFSGRYSHGFAIYDEEDEEEEEDSAGDFGVLQGYEDDGLDVDCFSNTMHSPSGAGTPSAVYLHRETAAGSVGFEDYEATERVSSPHSRHTSKAGSYSTSGSGILIPIPDDSEREHVDYIEPTVADVDAPSSPIPKLVVERGWIPSVEEEDENDFFNADADCGNEYMQRSRAGPRGGYGSRNRGFTLGGGSGGAMMDERPSRSTSRTTSERSRSKSHSRTPSPAIDGILASGPSDAQASRPNIRRTNSASASASPSSYASHLCPPVRGRSHQELSQGSLPGRSFSAGNLQSEDIRGRSTSRASSNAASSMGSSSSPFSGSPDAPGSRQARGGSAAIGGGRPDKERRGREPVKERERGRDRTTDKRLSVSVSASPELPGAMQRESSSATDLTASTYSSSASSSRTIVPEGAEEERLELPAPRPQPQQQDKQEAMRGKRRMTVEDYQRRAEDLLRRAHPTPSNSPILEMRLPQLPPTHKWTTSSSSVTIPPKQSVGASASSPTQAKPPNRPPPTLISSPTSPVQPSTSEYTAMSPTLKGGTSPQSLMSSVNSPVAGTPGAGSPSTTTPSSISPSGSVGGETENGEGKTRSSSRSRERTPATEGSIIGKAQEMVSNAGAYLGWWNHA